VSGPYVKLELSIEIESDPITGSLVVGADARQCFRGWMELVAAIESARQVPAGVARKTLGVSPGVNHHGM
jgi:hypothetical protein